MLVKLCCCLLVTVAWLPVLSLGQRKGSLALSCAICSAIRPIHCWSPPSPLMLDWPPATSVSSPPSSPVHTRPAFWKWEILVKRVLSYLDNLIQLKSNFWESSRKWDRSSIIPLTSPHISPDEVGDGAECFPSLLGNERECFKVSISGSFLSNCSEGKLRYKMRTN